MRESGEQPYPPSGRGWYSRGYIPHYDDSDKLQFITWRLADSLPANLLKQLERDLALLAIPATEREAEYRKRIERLLDGNHGFCWLRKPECARVVIGELLENEGRSHLLHAWVVMQSRPCSREIHRPGEHGRNARDLEIHLGSKD